MNAFTQGLQAVRDCASTVAARQTSKLQGPQGLTGHARGRRPYTLLQLQGYGRLRSNAKSTKKIRETVCLVLDLVYGTDRDGDAEAVPVPSASTFSRSTYKLDLLHMMLRRLQWVRAANAKRPFLVQLCFDSSPLKRDFFMCYETVLWSDSGKQCFQQHVDYMEWLERHHKRLVNVFCEESDSDDDNDNVEHQPVKLFPLESRVLPPVTLGQGVIW